MVRSAAALVAVLILPTFSQAQEPQAPEPQAQEPQGTHTVVRDDTLWDLAIRYYDSPWEWRVIFNANRDVVEDPHWIYPAEVLVIPGLPADRPAQAPVEEPMDEPEAEEVRTDLVPFGLRQPRPVRSGARTIFYDDTEEQRARGEASRSRDYVAVASDRVYSAPWLVRLERQPQSSGEVTGFAERGERGSTMQLFDPIRIRMPAPARVGANLQIFRVTRTIPRVGHVSTPVGVATVEALDDGHVVAIIQKVYGRIQAGDLVRPLPTYEGRAGEYAEPVSGGSEAMIMGVAGNQVITDVGHAVFLDLGSDDGIVIGDEFVLYGEALPDNARGALQVIYTTPTTATARVLDMDDDIWRQGVIVRLARKMR